jgi:predicted Zn-dependent protease
MKKYNEALKVLQELLKYQQTSFVYQWIGQIYLINHELSKGIVYLEKARQNDSRNSVLLYNLGRAYFNTSQFEKGNEIIGQLKQSSSDLSFISKLEAYKKSLLIN